MFYRKKKEEKIKLTDDKGQVLIEFILLFVVLVGTSILMVKLVNQNLADRWKAAIEVIAKPTDTNIQLK